MAMEKPSIEKPRTKLAHENKYETVINNHFLTWDKLVQEMLSLSGLSVFDRLDSPDLKLPKTSSAGNLGHKTLRKFVCSSTSNYGMSMSWDEWIKNVMAFRINKEIGANSADAETLIRDYNMVVEELGRKPSNSTDFSRALSHVKEQSVKRKKTENNLQLKGLSSRVNSLLVDIDYEKAASIQYKEEVGSLNGKMTEMSENHIKMLSDQENRLNLEAEEKIKALKIESESEKQVIRNKSQSEIKILKEAHTSEILSLRKDYEGQIEALKVAHEDEIKKVSDNFKLRINELTREISSLTSKYETGNYIEVSKYEELQAENVRYANRMEKYEAQIVALKIDLAALNEKMTQYEEEKTQNNALMGQLNIDIQEYQSKIEQFSIQKKRQESIFQDQLKNEHANIVKIEQDYKSENLKHEEEVAEINQMRSKDSEEHQKKVGLMNLEIKQIHQNNSEYKQVQKSKFSKILENLQSENKEHITQVHKDYYKKESLRKIDLDQMLALKAEEHVVEINIIREDSQKNIDALIKSNEEKELMYNKEILDKERLGKDALKIVEKDRVKQKEEFKINLKSISKEYEESLAKKESRFKKYEANIKKMEQKIDSTSFERLELLKSQLDTYRGYLTTAKENYKQLKFRHRVMTNSQFEMTEQMDGLTLVKGKLQQKLAKQNKKNRVLHRIIRKRKVQAILAIGVAVFVSLINWLMM
jgi:hypothetical protein